MTLNNSPSGLTTGMVIISTKHSKQSPKNLNLGESLSQMRTNPTNAGSSLMHVAVAPKKRSVSNIGNLVSSSAQQKDNRWGSLKNQPLTTFDKRDGGVFGQRSPDTSGPFLPDKSRIQIAPIQGQNMLIPEASPHSLPKRQLALQRL